MKRILAQIAVAGVLGTSVARADLVTNSTDITGNVTWRATNTYYLQKIIYVRTNATLTIEPGTVIKAMTTGLIGSPDVPTDCAALWVCRGGKLYATGTVTSPIIFTYDGDDVNNPNDVPYNTMGKWGGIVLCGRAQINSASDGNGQGATPKFEVFEGTTGGTNNPLHIFGGGDDTDSSGELRYISIRYPGIVFAPAKELNGLSLGGVGSGTVIEYVEVFNSADDGFEFFGGNVNTKHLISAFCDDDDFDTDMGYRGTNQFWFGIKPTWTGSSDSRGFETDGDLSQTGYPGNNATPISSWVVHNATLIGRGTNVSGFGGGVGWQPRDEARPNVFNSIFTDFAEGVRPEVDGTNEFFTGVADLRSSIFFVATNTTFDSIRFVFNDAARSNTLQSPLLGGISYTNNALLNPRPQPGSPALSNVAVQGAGLTTTSYRGAFGPNDNWANGWTALSALGNLSQSNNVIVNSDITGNATWHADTTYYLQKIIYVKTNATLTIEPGTVIKAMTTGLIGSPDVPTDCAALWVCRGGKLYATGTVTSPIIFTYDGDDVNNPNDVPYNTMGKWGGIVLCGRAQINSASDGNGQGATPKFEVFEGTTGGTNNPLHIFGGGDDTDSSGELRYISIRYPGIVFAPAKELNGLSLGGVGSGTVIEYVEVFNSADDGFEFFGGNVNTKHLISAFCDDDDFDTDMGYRGTNQFWFGIKPTWTGSSDSRGFETDGDLSQTGYPGNNATPISSWVVHNATLIGRGTNVSGFGGGVGWQPRDEARPNVFNSIFTDFAEGVRPEVDGTNEFFTGVADLRSSIFFVATNTTFDSIRFVFNDAARSNTLQSPLLGGISYTNNALLNPRPQPGSPALSNVAVQGAGLTTTSYRGAFGPNDNWANGWTALSALGNLGAPVNGAANPPLIGATKNGSNLNFVYATETGFNYQLQSTTNLINAVWIDEGSAVAGTGGSLTNIVPTTASVKFFRVKAQ